MNLNNLFEAANPAQQAAIAISMKKAGKKPKNEDVAEEKVRLDPKCWTGKKIGNPKTKVKGGVRVNNCVPAESINEFALPGGSDGDSGRWYTDDELADIIGDDWFEDFDVSHDEFNIDAYGEKAKQNLASYANSWFDDKGYNVNVMGVDHNDVDHDLKWYIVGSFQNDNFADKDVDEGLGSKLAGLGLAGAMALGSAGANARVTPDGQGGFTGGLKPSATVTAPADNKPAAEAPKGFSKEYLQKAADPNRFGRYMISVEKAQELLKNMQEGVTEDFEDMPDELMDPAVWKTATLKQKYKAVVDAGLIEKPYQSSYIGWMNDKINPITDKPYNDSDMPRELRNGELDLNKVYRKALAKYQDRKHSSDLTSQDREHELTIGTAGRAEIIRKANELAEMKRVTLRNERLHDEEVAFQRAETIQQRKDEMKKIADKYQHDLTVIDKEHRNNMESIRTGNNHEINKIDKEHAEARREREHSSSESDKDRAEREREREQNRPKPEKPKPEPEEEPRPRPSPGAGNKFDQDTGEPVKPNKPQQSNQWHTSQQLAAPTKPNKKNDDVTDVEPKPNKPLALKEKITVVKDPAKATGIQQTGGITHGSVYAGNPITQPYRITPGATRTPGKPLPQSLQQKLDGKSNTGRAVDAKGRTQQQWAKLVKAKFPDAKIMQSKMLDGPSFAMLPDGRKLTWNKVEQGIAESSQRVDSLVTDALKIMKGSEASDAVAALKTVLGDREYNGRRGYYNFYVRQMLDMLSQQGIAEAGYRNYDDNRTGFSKNSQAYRADGGANDENHELDRRREQQEKSGTWYIRLNGKLIKDKQGNPYTFRGKAAANKAALTMQAKLFNQGKEFMLTTNPNDKPQGVAEGQQSGYGRGYASYKSSK